MGQRPMCRGWQGKGACLEGDRLPPGSELQKAQAGRGHQVLSHQLLPPCHAPSGFLLVSLASMLQGLVGLPTGETHRRVSSCACWVSPISVFGPYITLQPEMKEQSSGSEGREERLGKKAGPRGERELGEFEGLLLSGMAGVTGEDGGGGGEVPAHRSSPSRG